VHDNALVYYKRLINSGFSAAINISKLFTLISILKTIDIILVIIE
jgi:hypothetical protein